jgi:Zn2+/Cd2+-exporting ATPase
VLAVQESGQTVVPASDVAAVTGAGVNGTWQGQPYQVGKLNWLKSQGLNFQESRIPGLTAAIERGETVVGVAAVGDTPRELGAISIADTLRPTASRCLEELRRLGINELIMLTGDAEPVARELGRKLELGYRAALLPADKLNAIRELKDRIGPVGMIGDGMNDAPSLAAADLGFSLGGAGTDVALETADVVIMAEDLRRLPYAIRLARRTRHIIRQNLGISFGVMGLLLISAFVVQLPLPLVVLGHEGSTVVVILNGLRLLRYRHVSE